MSGAFDLLLALDRYVGLPREIFVRWIWPILFLLAFAACADDGDRLVPLLRAEAGPVDIGDARVSPDVAHPPGAMVSGTFTVTDLDGRSARGVTVKIGELEARTDIEGRVRLPIGRNAPFTVNLLLPNAAPHWSQGRAPDGPFAHTILVLSDARLDSLFAALPEPPMDGSGVLLVEAPVGASVYADGRPGFLWRGEGPVSGDIVSSDGPRLVVFPGLPEGAVDVVVQRVDGRPCAPLPAGEGELDPRVRGGGVTHVAFRCP